MISLLGPYFLTFIGIIISGVHDFPAMAVLLTVIGVLWTLIGGKMKGYDKVGILISEAVQAADGRRYRRSDISQYDLRRG